MPAAPGSYALRLSLSAPLRLAIGRLGSFSFPAGEYFYLGSAHGPGGLRARLRHHARVADHSAPSRARWHLDWLRPHAALLGGWYALGSANLECPWSRALLDLPGAAIPAPGFGAADCRASCPAHLVAFPTTLVLARVAMALSFPGVVLQPFKLPTIT